MTASTSEASIAGIVARGEIGGRTLQIVESGAVECAAYEPAALRRGMVRVRTLRSAISPGTEMTFFGRAATNVYLHKRWNERLRIFEPGAPSMEYPLVFGYRAAGEVVESRSDQVAVGLQVYGSWRHTELTTVSGEYAATHPLPDGLTLDDGVDLAQMGPICVNGVAFGGDEHVGAPAVVFGAGVVGLITAQVARASGADPVYVVDHLTSRLAIAAGLGLTPVEAVPGDVAARLKERHGSEGIPVAWEATGSTSALHEAIRVVRRRGNVVAMGFYQGEGVGLALGDEFHHNGICITSGQIGNLHPAHTWETLRERITALALSGDVKLGALPRLTLPIERANDAFAALSRPAEVLQVALSYEASAA